MTEVPKKGGKKAKRGKNHPILPEKQKVIVKEDGQEYAQVQKVLGGGTYLVKCFDGKIRNGHKRGALKKTKIQNGEMLLISKRDFQDHICDVILKYSREEVRELVKKGELPDETQDESKISSGITFEDEPEGEFDFASI